MAILLQVQVPGGIGKSPRRKCLYLGPSDYAATETTPDAFEQAERLAYQASMACHPLRIEGPEWLQGGDIVIYAVAPEGSDWTIALELMAGMVEGWEQQGWLGE